mmetsp:Transcript_38585/g.106492  ORF Transcript_38585/g.106492 Transcript_38585/m.106492 type:complete len:249 (-) Transcript_38585:57-803(-)|eukprot:1180820-Prymnesium_polylepis.1
MPHRCERPAVPARSAPAAAVIFLDCDGVLANARSQSCHFDEADPTLLLHPTNAIAPLERRCLAELQRVVEATGASIVLTTTWRQVAAHRSFLVSALQPFAQVLGDTPTLSDRGSEVRAWLRAHPDVTRYAIIDDDHSEWFELAGLSDHCVQTVLCDDSEPSAEGLTAVKADEAIALLIGGPVSIGRRFETQIACPAIPLPAGTKANWTLRIVRSVSLRACSSPLGRRTCFVVCVALVVYARLSAARWE